MSQLSASAIRVFAATVALFAVAASAAAGWDANLAMRGVWYSAAAYCETSTYASRTFRGPTTGFKVTKVINERTEDTNGFVGYLTSQKEIVVAFRGSTSIEDWITNLDAVRRTYTGVGCSGCSVHNGFLEAQQLVAKEINAEVSRLLKLYPSYKVVVTGHSLGGAMGILQALDLLGATQPAVTSGGNLRLYTYGQPRVGEVDFSAYPDALINAKGGAYYRVVHDRDIVPHNPPMATRFVHSVREVWEMDNGKLAFCSTTDPEDDDCSNSCWAPTSIPDHLEYLSFPISSCEAVSAGYDLDRIIEAKVLRMQQAALQAAVQLEETSMVADIAFAPIEEAL